MAAADSVPTFKSEYLSSVRRVKYLHKGQQKVAASASIPSKYQTIVISNDEKKGFNTGSKRFGAQQYNDSPGPAQYNVKQTLLKENNPSLSKKGLGGFVSKVKRFPAPLNEIYSVGPGYYTPSTKSSHDFNRASCTSNFHPPIAVQGRIRQFQTPAPNQYNLTNGIEKRTGASVAFLSRTRRDLVTVKMSNFVPAPGAYEINENLTSCNPRATQAPFRSTTTRDFLSKSLLENPGPGTYNPYKATGVPMEKNGFPRKHYLCISAPAIPMPPQPPSPGPGQYNLVNYQGPQRRYVSSSMFVSTTNRWNNNNNNHNNSNSCENPGPGTYNPRHVPKLSFIYNADQKWI